MSDVILEADELEGLAQDALEAGGVPQAKARDVAQILVLGDLFGVHTHGVQRVSEYLSRARVGGVNPAADVQVRRVAPSIVTVEGNNGLGPAIGLSALRATLECAHQTGAGVGFVSGSNHFGALMPYSFLAAEAGFASVIASNATTTMTPWGGQEARLGNNPFAIGVPFPGGDHVILDMALSVVARAKIRAAERNGEAIPSSWATDSSGAPTTDATKALQGFLQPMGGHKGYGLAVMVDMLAGVLSGASFLTQVSSWSTDPQAPQGLGHCMILIDTKKLGTTEWLAARVEEFAGILRSARPSSQDVPVQVPGEREMAEYHRQRREGVTLPAEDVDALRALVAVNRTTST